MKTVDFEYGQGTMTAELPDSADIFVPGETVPDPPALEDPLAATRESILNPIGMDPIAKLADRGSKVVIVFPDKVKGGFQKSSHRKVSIPMHIQDCLVRGGAAILTSSSLAMSVAILIGSESSRS